jgi:hypothetical protein
MAAAAARVSALEVSPAGHRAGVSARQPSRLSLPRSRKRGNTKPTAGAASHVQWRERSAFGHLTGRNSAICLPVHAQCGQTWQSTRPFAPPSAWTRLGPDEPELLLATSHQRRNRLHDIAGVKGTASSVYCTVALVGVAMAAGRGGVVASCPRISDRVPGAAAIMSGGAASVMAACSRRTGLTCRANRSS